MGIQDADGAFAELVAVPTANLHVVPESLDDEEAVFCEPLAAAFEILEQLTVEPGEPCIVFGDGKLGVLVAQVLHAAGAKVRAVGRHESKLAILAKRGIETARADRWKPETARLVVDATGSAAGLRQAIAATEPRGTLVLKSTLAESPRIDWAPIVIHEIRVQGSRCGPFEPALVALTQEIVDVRSLISDRFGLDDAARALARAAEAGTGKVLLDCG
jgi:threonine dehydrogenase-like Zn-dependent dehydrogenase